RTRSLVVSLLVLRVCVLSVSCSCLLSSFMILRPPIFTLFPYTTLFRSRSEAKHVGVADRLRAQTRAERIADDAAQSGVGPAIRLDRKSTRLNSSHQIISYAVFCLKKKKQKKSIPSESAIHQQRAST